MSYKRHHSIIVSSSLTKDASNVLNLTVCIEDVHAKAKSLFGYLVSEIINSGYNNIHSFFIAPDGSYEERKHSNHFNYLRDSFILYMKSLKYDDGSSSFDWVEVQFGDDDGDDRVLLSS